MKKQARQHSKGRPSFQAQTARLGSPPCGTRVRQAVGRATHSTAEVRPKHEARSALREEVKRCDCDFEHLQGGPGGGSSPMQQHE